MEANEAVEKDWRKMLEASDFSLALTERDQAHRAEVRSILLDFLQVLDSLDRLITHGDEVVAANLGSLRRQLLGAFESAGVHFLESMHRPFDPQWQEAVEARHDSTQEPGTVVEEMRRGCEWQGDLLRRAQVVVTK